MFDKLKRLFLKEEPLVKPNKKRKKKTACNFVKAKNTRFLMVNSTLQKPDKGE